MQTRWVVREKNPPLIKEMSSELGISPLTAHCLINRGVSSVADGRAFFHGTLDTLADPLSLKGMEAAVRRILEALDRHETIMIHGDYDVDGVASSALLARVLARLGARHCVYLPHRQEDGYGFSANALDRAQAEGVKLIVTVDCGITAHQEIEAARAMGIDVIVTDHHEVDPDAFPEAVSVVNPHQDGCPSPFKELAGVGVAYKLARALIGRAADEYLDLVALGTIADVCPLVFENHIVAREGLVAIAQRPSLGVRSLIRAAGLDGRPITAYHIGFVLAPRINACGRMGAADAAFELLVTEDPRRADELADVLERENRERQRVERGVLREALAAVQREIDLERDKAIVVWGEGWHVGVIGIVASRLVDKYNRPALVISMEGDAGKGSGRSVGTVNLYDVLSSAREHVTEFGGHEGAVGCSVKREALPQLRQKVAETVSLSQPVVGERVRTVDAEIPLKLLSFRQVDELERLEPFGCGNPKPVFMTTDLSLKRPPAQVTNQTVKFNVTDGTTVMDAVWFGCAGYPFQPDERVDLVYTPRRNTWQGQTSIQLIVSDVQLSKEPVGV